MPELPEVETVRRGLLPVLEGAVIERAVAHVPKLRFDVPVDFSARLQGNRVEALRRRSKYILADCADGLTVIIHLGMSGRMTIHAPGQEVASEKHDHIVLTTGDGVTIVYNDPRRFGLWTFAERDTVDEHPLIAGIGPEPLGNGFNVDVLNAGLTGRKSPIKAALLDQTLVAGLGNIYVCEALWRAHIHPERPAHTVAGADAERLVPIIRDVLNEAIAAGGSTLKDYAQVDGELGYFQHSFKAYGREGEPCHTPGCSGMVARIAQSNRSSFFCPECQH